MPTQHKGPQRERRALDAFIKMSRASSTLAAELAKGVSIEGLTEGQFGVLEALYHLGPMNQREIGRKVLRSNANVCTVVDNLERASFVERRRDPDDARAIIVSLTPAGKRLMGRVFPAHAARVTALMGTLSEEEQERLGALCKKLGLAAAAERGSG